MTLRTPLHAEPTEAGIQTLIPGVAPLSLRDRLLLCMTAPLSPTRPQKPADLGLFDLAARNQLELFGVSGRADERATARTDPDQPASPPGITPTAEEGGPVRRRDGRERG